MKQNIVLTLVLTTALLALCACTDDTDNPGNGNGTGTDGNPAACLTPRDISYASPVLGGVPRAAGGGSSRAIGAVSSRALHEDLGTTGTPLPPNALITAFTSGDALTLSYSFSPAADADPADAASYPYRATLTRADAGAVPLWTPSAKDTGTNPLRPNADAHPDESWADARALLTYDPAGAAGSSSSQQGADGSSIQQDAEGYSYLSVTDAANAATVRQYYDRLIASTATAPGTASTGTPAAPGSLRIVTDLDDPNLGQFSATLKHAGAMLRLPAGGITIGTDFLEGYTAADLTLTATVRPAGGSADGTDDYTLGFSRATGTSGSSGTGGGTGSTAGPLVVGGTQQALLPPGATVLAFQAVLTKGEGYGTATFPLSTSPITVAANRRYPMTLTLTATKAEVSFSEPTGVPGFGEDEEEIESDAIEKLDYNEVKDASGNVTGWTVHTAAGLKGFAKLVNSATSNTDAVLKLNCTLTANIDLSLLPKDDTGSNWMPIGAFDYSNLHFYQGTFDGGGHTVSGLVINRPNTDYQGFFGYIGKEGSPATVKNLTVEGTVTGKRFTGGVVGYNNSSTITNCTNTGSVTGTSDTGGVAGYNDNSSTITNCTNTGSVAGTGYDTGGVTGYNDNSSTITNCTNTGSVAGTGDDTGGVAGYNDNSSTITNCTNTGSVTGTNNTGGVVGNNISSTITACTNTGSVTSTGDSTGGVAGANASFSSSSLTACYNTGSVTGTNYTGGVVGYNASFSSSPSTITACYNTGGVTGTNWTGGVAGVNSFTSTITTCYWQTFGPTDSRPEKGVGSGTGTDLISISSAYTDDTPSWLVTDGTSGPIDKLNDAIDTWNAELTDPADQKKSCLYRYVANPAYPAALAAGADKAYDTPVPPLLLEIPTTP